MTIFRFQAEQVSHNPPVTAFHLECPDKIQVQGHLSVKAKLMGMYVGTTLGGDFTLELSQLNEKYELGYPSLYVHNATPFEKSLAIGTLIWSSRVNCLRSEPVWNAKKQMYFALQTGLDPKNFTRAKLV